MSGCNFRSLQGAMERLCLFAVFVLTFFTNSISGSSLKVNKDICEQKEEEFLLCSDSAYEEYRKAIVAGDDGRPDWMARKSCNYVTAAVEDCMNELIGECYSEEEINRKKDNQLDGKMEQLSESISEWDSEKCPVIKAYLKRKNKGFGNDKDTTEKEEEEEEGTENFADKVTFEIGTLEAGSGTEENANPEEEKTSDLGAPTDNKTESEEKEVLRISSTVEPESGSEALAVSLSLLIVVYMISSA